MAVNMRVEDDTTPFYTVTCMETMLTYATITGSDIGYHIPSPPWYCAPFIIADLPATAVTETLLIPVDSYQHLRAAKERKANRDPLGDYPTPVDAPAPDKDTK